MVLVELPEICANKLFEYTHGQEKTTNQERKKEPTIIGKELYF